MTRSEAVAVLRGLAGGLEPDLAGVLERIAGHDEVEVLRDVLVEEGAAALLEGGRP
jgi:hypothetical protein